MRWEFLLLVGLTACPGPGTSDDVDAPVAGGRVLHLAWSAIPAEFPPQTGDTKIDHAAFNAENLRVIGDAVGPGDQRTFINELSLEWAAAMSPSAHAFLDAPSGEYSKVVFELESDSEGSGKRHAFEITGSTVVEGVSRLFSVRDDNERSISVSIDPQVSLMPTDDKTIRIKIDLTHVVEVVNFKVLPTKDGRLVLDGNDPQIGVVRQKLVEAFANDTSVQQ